VCERCARTASSRACVDCSGGVAFPREGLLITPTWAIHTGFMRFEIDGVFLDAELNVLDVRRDINRWRAAARFGAKSVLELAAGESEWVGIRVGDRLTWGS
jgi:uncharacterized membrane protein (UPF0127 family)